MISPPHSDIIEDALNRFKDERDTHMNALKKLKENCPPKLQKHISDLEDQVKKEAEAMNSFVKEFNNTRKLMYSIKESVKE